MMNSKDVRNMKREVKKLKKQYFIIAQSLEKIRDINGEENRDEVRELSYYRGQAIGYKGKEDYCKLVTKYMKKFGEDDAAFFLMGVNFALEDGRDMNFTDIANAKKESKRLEKEYDEIVNSLENIKKINPDNPDAKILSYYHNKLFALKGKQKYFEVLLGKRKLLFFKIFKGVEKLEKEEQREYLQGAREAHDQVFPISERAEILNKKQVDNDFSNVKPFTSRAKQNTATAEIEIARRQAAAYKDE